MFGGETGFYVEGRSLAPMRIGMRVSLVRRLGEFQRVLYVGYLSIRDSRRAV